MRQIWSLVQFPRTDQFLLDDESCEELLENILPDKIDGQKSNVETTNLDDPANVIDFVVKIVKVLVAQLSKSRD